MHRHKSAAAVLLGCLLPAFAPAADLARYRDPPPRLSPDVAKTAKYCLLVFGPNAKTHVWLAWDGKYIYADRSGHGDLSASQARIKGKKSNEQDPDNEDYLFEIGDVPDGDRLHKDVTVAIGALKALQSRPDASSILARDPKARSYNINASIDMLGFQGVATGNRLLQSAGYYCGSGNYRR